MTPSGKALGEGAPLTFAGKTYTVGPWAYDVQLKYESYLIGRAYARLREQRPEMGAEYEDERAALRRDVDAGLYDFGEPLVQRSLNTKKNFTHLLFLCLAWGHRQDPKTDVSPDLARRMTEREADHQAAVEAMLEANRDPNAPPPAPGPEGPGAGGPADSRGGTATGSPAGP